MNIVSISSGVPTTTSLQVAKTFGKRHERVLDAIKTLVHQLPADTQHNFVPSCYVDSTGRTLPSYTITRDGFSLLAMGFTGARALQFKLDYIKAFNQMEQALLAQTINHQSAYWQQKRVEGKQVRLAWGGCVQEFVLYAKAQGSQSAEKYYMAITKMEYSALELVKAASDKHFRDSLDTIQHGQLTVVEMAAQQALQQGMDANLHYKVIFQHCKAACVQLAESLRKYLPAAANASHMRLIGGVAA